MNESVALKEFGFNFLGPILYTYFKSVEKHLESGSFHVFHLAREGYYLKKAFDELTSNQWPSTYLYVSRTFLFRIMITDTTTWEQSLKHGFEGQFFDFLISRFGFTPVEAEKLVTPSDKHLPISLPKDIEKVSNLLLQRLEQIDSIVSDSKQEYLKYLANIGLLNCKKTPLFLDLGYSGTIQKLLTRLIGQNTEGHYFIATKAGVHKVNELHATMHYAYQSNVKMGGGYLMLDRSMFLESLLTAPNGQFIDIRSINGKQKYFFGRKSYSQNNPGKLRLIFEGAIDALLDFKYAEITFSKEDIENLFKAYTTQRHALPSITWPLFEFDDAISGFGTVNPLTFFRL